MTKKSFYEVGKETSQIGVSLSYKIIELFSEGLYSSPHKALEELVSNAFDAGAENVHVLLSPDLRDDDATIAVIDDGEGMDAAGLQLHWLIGVSKKRKQSMSHGRKPIGKFGIGKLATYVLAERLTHICKSKGKFYSTSIDYRKIPAIESNSISETTKLQLPLMELSEKEAMQTLSPWIVGDGPGHKAMKLFGKDAKKSWTVAIMSDLKTLGQEMQPGRLQWVLRTAMPLREDFKLYFNDTRLESSHIDKKPAKTWVIGKDILQLDPPAPKDFEVVVDKKQKEDSESYYGLSNPKLGRIVGYMELYDDALEGGKSDAIAHSNGFFVYVRGRLINVDEADSGFGIDRNQLRHGTFSRLRVIIHIDGLDDDLRSSREKIRQGEKFELARNTLHAMFNLARNEHMKREQSMQPGIRMLERFASAPGSMTRKPLATLVEKVLSGKATPWLLRWPTGLTSEQKSTFITKFKEDSNSPDKLITSSEMTELGADMGMAVYDAETRKLKINAAHPFVASFIDEFDNAKLSQPLEIFVMAEVLTEANLYDLGLEESQIRDILNCRDVLFRQLVRASGRRNAQMISLALLDARDNANQLEEEARAALEVIGFDNVIHIGGPNKPDGTAEARLAPDAKGSPQYYKIGFETKSGKTTSASRLGASKTKRHMGDYECNHHLVIGTGFQTTDGEESATIREIKETFKDTDKTVTLVEIEDFAKLTKLAPIKRVGVKRLRELFRTCISPEESKKWIELLAKEKTGNPPYKEILEAIKDLGSKTSEAIQYQSVSIALNGKGIKLSTEEVHELCRAMHYIVPGDIYALEKTVELVRRPDMVLADIKNMAIDEAGRNSSIKI